MISFNQVSKIYPGCPGKKELIALNEVSFQIEKGEFVLLVGKSGSGKTTIFKLLLGEEDITSGTVLLDDFNIKEVKDINKVRRKIGMIFQDYRLISSKTIFENIAYPLEVSGCEEEKINKEVIDALETVNLIDKVNYFPRELSGGEQQRAAIARALICRPDIILADEPTGNLDPYHTIEVLNLLTKINNFGITIILATHDREIVNSLNKRVITLEEGRVIKDVKKGKFIL